MAYVFRLKSHFMLDLPLNDTDEVSWNKLKFGFQRFSILTRTKSFGQAGISMSVLFVARSKIANLLILQYIYTFIIYDIYAFTAQWPEKTCRIKRIEEIWHLKIKKTEVSDASYQSRLQKQVIFTYGRKLRYRTIEDTFDVPKILYVS